MFVLFCLSFSYGSSVDEDSFAGYLKCRPDGTFVGKICHQGFQPMGYKTFHAQLRRAWP